MKLAFYYHISMRRNMKGEIMLPAYFGVFVDSLASCVDELCLIMHESDKNDTGADYVLQGKNIQWQSLGKKTPAWHRAVFYRKILRKPLLQVEDYNVLLVRSPSPLAPYFFNYLKSTKIVYLIVGDYSDDKKNRKNTSLRKRFINYFLAYNIWLFDRQIKKTDIVVNSSMLYEKYKNKSKSIHHARTTTLSKSDFFIRKDTCQNDAVQLVYTGRIDPQKGLFELVDATCLLIKSNYNVICNIVGWEPDREEPVKNALIAYAKSQNVEDKIIFHDKKKVGDELNAMYRMGDIYVIPSYHEGFPRTIWEAMANSLPVIASTVGGIPGFLKHQEDAQLIEPKSSQAIYDAVVKLINNNELRERMIIRGQLLARENTLENQTHKLVKILENLAQN